MNKKVRQVVTANGGAIVGEEYFPLDHTDYGNTIDKITSSGAQVVFNTIVPPGLTPFLEQLYNSGFTKRGGYLVCTYFDENFLNLVPAAHVEGLYSCLDYYQNVSDPFSKKLITQYDKLYPGNAKFTAGSACSGLYRGLRLWEAAVKEAGSLKQDDVIKALDHAKIAEGPGGPAEMVPGQHHVRTNMYIAQAKNGNFRIVKSLGAFLAAFPIITVSVTLTIVTPVVLVSPVVPIASAIPIVLISPVVPIASAIPIVPIGVVEAAGQHWRHKKNGQENQQGVSHFLAPFALFCKRRRDILLRLLH